MLTTRHSASRVTKLPSVNQSLTKMLQYSFVKTMTTAKILEEPHHEVTEIPRQKNSVTLCLRGERFWLRLEAARWM